MMISDILKKNGMYDRDKFEAILTINEFHNGEKLNSKKGDFYEQSQMFFAIYVNRLKVVNI